MSSDDNSREASRIDTDTPAEENSPVGFTEDKLMPGSDGEPGEGMCDGRTSG